MNAHLAASPDFAGVLARHGLRPPAHEDLHTLQVNLGKVCNQACHHCHVDAGPKRTESMSADTAKRVLLLLAASPRIDTVDITGGAPELNPNFRSLVRWACMLRRQVIVRCNLTVLLLPGMKDLPAFYARNRVAVVSSLPCYSAENVDAQRGRGVFDASIEALRRLNAQGYGRDPRLELSLAYNPAGASLPPAQAELEDRYRQELRTRHGIVFNQLLALTNMPIRRFADQLRRRGQLGEYSALLQSHFNPATVASLMCRTLVSVSWDGFIYDCDFNQMQDMPLRNAASEPLSIWDIDAFDELAGVPADTASHCFGCTAGNGSSCGGALARESDPPPPGIGHAEARIS